MAVRRRMSLQKSISCGGGHADRRRCSKRYDFPVLHIRLVDLLGCSPTLALVSVRPTSGIRPVLCLAGDAGASAIAVPIELA